MYITQAYKCGIACQQPQFNVRTKQYATARPICPSGRGGYVALEIWVGHCPP